MNDTIEQIAKKATEEILKENDLHAKGNPLKLTREDDLYLNLTEPIKAALREVMREAYLEINRSLKNEFKKIAAKKARLNRAYGGWNGRVYLDEIKDLIQSRLEAKAEALSREEEER